MKNERCYEISPIREIVYMSLHPEKKANGDHEAGKIVEVHLIMCGIKKINRKLLVSLSCNTEYDLII